MITMMYDVLVIGSNMMELTTEIDRMPQLGETVAAPNFHMAFGGKGGEPGRGRREIRHQGSDDFQDRRRLLRPGLPRPL